MRSQLIIFMLLLSGCMAGYQATGPSYAESQIELRDIPANLSRIIVFRTDEYTLYFGRPAFVKSDEKEIASVPKGGISYVDLEPSSLEIYTEEWDYPGRCGYVLGAEAGHSYFFEIVPRKESFLKGFFIGMGSAFEIAMAKKYEVIDGECRGLFALVPIEEDAAMDKIQVLRYAK